jgi:hypothetical protein
LGFVPQTNLQSFKNKEKIKMAKIDIKDLIGGAVENAIARREESLTAEEAKQIQGGASFSTSGGKIIIKPSTCGMICPDSIQS